MYTGMKSLEKYKNRINEISDERSRHESSDDGIWIYLKDNWETSEGTQTIHESTVRACIEKLKECVKIETVESQKTGRLISYLRVSTKDQTIENQRMAINKKGYEISKEYTDEGLTGTNTDREGLIEMLSLVKKGDTVIIYSFSRLARSTRDLLSIIEKLKKIGVELISLTENVDTATATGKLMITMLGALAEFEVETMKERQAIGIERAKAEGKYKGRKSKELTEPVRELISKWIRKELSQDDVLLLLKENHKIGRTTAFKLKRQIRQEV